MRKLTFILFALIFSSLFLVDVSVSDFPPDPEGEYSPWGDLNDDGKIDIFDIVWLVSRYGTTGTPLNVTELLLELQTRMDVLNATVIALEEQISGTQGCEVRIGTQTGTGGFTVNFSQSFPNGIIPEIFAIAVLTVDDPGSSNLLKGMCPYPAVINLANTGFDVILKEEVGGANMMTATADVYYIAIGTENISTTQTCAGTEDLTVDSSSQVTITFTGVTFSNASSINLSASAIVTTATTGEGYPARVAGVSITIANAVLTLECWNGASYASLVQDDMVQVSWVAVGE